MGHVHYLCACLSTVVVTLPVWADTAKKIDFAHDIVPLIKKHCGECHTNGKRKGSLSLDTRESILKAKVAVPGKSSDSELLKRIAASGTGSFLAVLKVFGDRPPAGILSFPRAGTTLALDFPNHGAATFSLLDRLDDIVAAAGGAVYPAKDARLSGTRFRQYFPRWQEMLAQIDPKFSSGFWRRVME